jgi:hypothetical protein
MSLIGLDFRRLLPGFRAFHGATCYQRTNRVHPAVDVR